MDDMTVEDIPRLDVPWLNNAGFGGSGTSSSSSDNGVPPAVRRRPIPRKGHTKSRRGCYQCKRRKVKCQETLPECDHCKRIGLACEYPPNPRLRGLSPSMALQSTPTVFSLDDLRFHQHFLLTAYPPLPIQGDAVWREVAVISHEFDFLIHAMLGLAASHLTLLTGVDYSRPALAHRIASINSINSILSHPCASKAEADARFATFMTLTFQSSCMEEGMLDFLSMIRGCAIVGHSAEFFNNSIFNSFSREKHIETVRSLPFNEPELPNTTVIEPFLASLRSLGPLCQSTAEIRFLATIERVVKLARDSSLDAFAESATLYGVITESSNDDFVNMINPENYAAKLLFVHFFLVEYAVGSQVLGPIIERGFPFRKRMALKWLDRVRGEIPQHLKHHMQWPVEFADSQVN